MELWAAEEKQLLVSVAVPPAPVRVPSQRLLARQSLMIWVIMNCAQIS